MKVIDNQYQISVVHFIYIYYTIWTGADMTGADLTEDDLTWGRFDLGPILFGADLTCYHIKVSKG